MKKLFTYITAMLLTITSTTQAADTTHSDALVDKNATTETVNLFYNLYQVAQEGTIVGQQVSYSRRDGDDGATTGAGNPSGYSDNTDIYTVTGKRPLIHGDDLFRLTDKQYAANNWWGGQVNITKETIIKSYEDHGVFTTFSWHFMEPYGESDFYANKGGLSDEVKYKAFKSILEGGEKHEYYKGKLDMIADFFKSLKDKDGKPIPVMFRPFHEMGGNWFWWGIPHYASAAEYIQNWQFTVKYLRDVKGVHNVLYAFSPDLDWTTKADFLKCYPGDDYVDIIGYDSYENFNTGSSWLGDKNGADAQKRVIKQLKVLDQIAKERGKIAALTECGCDLNVSGKVNQLYSKVYADILEQSNADIAFMLFWSGAEYLPTNTTDPHSLKNDLKTFFAQDNILSKDNTDNLFATPASYPIIPTPGPTTDPDVTSTPIFNLPLNEESSTEVPEGFTFAGNLYATPEIVGVNAGAENDSEHGWVRTFAGQANNLKSDATFSANGTDARTFAYWAKLDGTKEEHQMFSTGWKESAIANNELFMLIHKENQVIIGGDYSSNCDRVVFENDDVASLTDAWHHFVVVIPEGAKSSEMKCYVDGELYAAGIAKNKDNTTMASDYVLNTLQGDIRVANSIYGSLSKVKIYDSALNEVNVKELYDAEKPGGTTTDIAQKFTSNNIVIRGKQILVNGRANIQIYDTTGRLAMQRSGVSGQISVENLSGIYILRANVDGELVAMKAAF